MEIRAYIYLYYFGHRLDDLCRFPEPIPSGVSVPGWAYLDVEVGANFPDAEIPHSVTTAGGRQLRSNKREE